jgi:hypothetical protein
MRKHYFREMDNYLPCQPTIAAQLLGNGSKIEPYTKVDCSGTRLKRLPVISREHFRKTRTSTFINTYWVSL